MSLLFKVNFIIFGVQINGVGDILMTMFNGTQPINFIATTKKWIDHKAEVQMKKTNQPYKFAIEKKKFGKQLCAEITKNQTVYTEIWIRDHLDALLISHYSMNLLRHFCWTQ